MRIAGEHLPARGAPSVLQPAHVGFLRPDAFSKFLLGQARAITHGKELVDQLKFRSQLVVLDLP